MVQVGRQVAAGWIPLPQAQFASSVNRRLQKQARVRESTPGRIGMNLFVVYQLNCTVFATDETPAGTDHNKH